MTNEFEFLDVRELRTPEAEAHQDVNSDGEDVLVIHEELNPYGWVASSATTEVQR